MSKICVIFVSFFLAAFVVGFEEVGGLDCVGEKLENCPGAGIAVFVEECDDEMHAVAEEDVWAVGLEDLQDV